MTSDPCTYCSSSAVTGIIAVICKVDMCLLELHAYGSFFFFCVLSYISGAHYSSSSAFPAISLGLIILLLLRSQLYLWGSPFFFFFFCVSSYISGAHYSYSSSSAFPAISLGFTILLLLLMHFQLYLWGSLFFFFFCVPSYISGVHHSSSSAFPAISLGFTILGESFAYVTIFCCFLVGFFWR